MQVRQDARAEGDATAMEQALVARARDDPAAVAELYDRYVERLYRYSFRRLGSHADAEDVTAQTFRRALERLDRYECRGMPFGAWLFRIAHNLIIDRYRDGGRQVSLDALHARGLEPATDAAAPEAELLEREDFSAAWAAVTALAPLQRRAVTLRFGQSLSHAEIGRRIGRSEPATKQLVYRAMQRLRKELGEG